MKSSITGLLFGCVLGLASFPVLWINEGRAVKTARGLKEGASAVASVSADSVDAANEGKLVHVSGSVTTSGELKDPVFGVSQPALQLIRTVEMYQWKERAESGSSSSNSSSGGNKAGVSGSRPSSNSDSSLSESGDSTPASASHYRYEKVWSGELIRSSGFKNPEGHANPSEMPFTSEKWVAQDAKLGAFRFHSGLVGRLPGAEPVNIQRGDYEYEAALRPTLRDGVLYLGLSPTDPSIGDVRVRWQALHPGDASVVARQVKDGFEPYRTRSDTRIEMVKPGIHSADAMFASAESANKALTWGLRVLGFFLMFFGIMLIFKPLSAVGRLIPFLGRILDAGLTLFAGLMSAMLSLVVIAVSWVAYRPVLAFTLVALAVALVVGGSLLVARKQRPLATAPA